MTHIRNGLAAGFSGIGLSTVTHSICCGALPVLMAGAAQTGAAMGSHAHDAMGMGLTLGIGAVTTAAVATGLTCWQQRHAKTDASCAHTCLPHKVERKKAGASWGQVWAANAMIGALSFLAIQGAMHATDFNRHQETVLTQPETGHVLVVTEEQTAWGLVPTHRHYQGNINGLDIAQPQGITKNDRVRLYDISEEFGDSLRRTLQWQDVTHAAQLTDPESMETGNAGRFVLRYAP